MDPIDNPFSPGAGSPPPELVGRDPTLEQARILFGRIKQKRFEKSILLTGLRGVGKTVLLNEIERLAKQSRYQTIFIEAHEDKGLARLIVPHLRGLLFDLDRSSGPSDKVKRSLAVLHSFIEGIKLKSDLVLYDDIEAEQGTADSGDLEVDLPNLFIAIGEAADDLKTGVAIFIDEIQYFNQKELGSLIMAMHKVQQLQLPLVLIGAGLPTLPGLAGDSKTYAERLFSFPMVGALSAKDSEKALNDPAKAAGVNFSEEALQEIYRLTQGYPYFLQEWAYHSWNRSEEKTISLQVVQDATSTVIESLDHNFFKVRFDRLTPTEKNFLRAIAEPGSSSKRTGEIALALNIKPNTLSPIRSSLIKKGMIYSPAYGDIAFTVPLFDEFIIREIPNLKS
jgi:hypothetical protein